MRKLLAVILCLAIVLSGGCSGEDPHSVPGSAEDNLIVVGFSQVGAESEWRVTNTENIKSVLSEDNGYMLISMMPGRNRKTRSAPSGCSPAGC